jgi:hypothetical protein
MANTDVVMSIDVDAIETHRNGGTDMLRRLLRAPADLEVGVASPLGCMVPLASGRGGAGRRRRSDWNAVAGWSVVVSAAGGRRCRRAAGPLDTGLTVALMTDDDNRCPACRHFWVTNGSEPDPDGRGLIMSSMAERTAMAEEDRRLQREGVPPEVAGPRAYRDLRYCGCQERPAPGSEWDIRLACEAARQAELYGR